MNKSFVKNCLITEVQEPIAAANNTDENTDILDMANYEGVVFIVPIEDSAATGVATATIQENTANSDSGMAAITGGAATKTCTVNDDINGHLLVAEVYRPDERYVQCALTSSVANIAFGTVIAIRYGAKKYPITEDTTVSNSVSVATG